MSKSEEHSVKLTQTQELLSVAHGRDSYYGGEVQEFVDSYQAVMQIHLIKMAWTRRGKRNRKR